MAGYRDPKSWGYMTPGAASGASRLDAPGGGSYARDGAPAALRCPGPLDPMAGDARDRSFPRVGDYAVEPETGTELFQGERREALPAGPLHSRQHAQVAAVVRAYAAPGFGADADLLTRQSEDDNFASDACIRRDGVDPATGDRFLEELAFEIKSTQSEQDLRTRARVMSRRGVRRVFAIPVRGDATGSRLEAGPVREWLPGEDTWRVLGRDEVIEDPCLYRPLPARALLEAAEADRAVARAYLDKHIDVLEEYGAERHQEGQREALLMILESRGIRLDAGARERIAACVDAAEMQRWLARAMRVSSAGDLFAGE